MTTEAKASSTPAKKDPIVVGINLYPDLDKPKRNGPYRFPAGLTPASSAKAANKNQQLEFNEETRRPLTPGFNEVSWEAYQAMQTNPDFGRCVRRGVLKVILPTINGKPTYSTVDYGDDDVADVIEQCNDEAWLERSMAKDDRDGIADLCRQRLDDLKTQTNNPAGDE